MSDTSSLYRLKSRRTYLRAALGRAERARDHALVRKLALEILDVVARMDAWKARPGLINFPLPTTIHQ